VLAHTKTKGEVRGGGKKPWKQKGTGRARHGSSRSPIWVGGGITFGPRKDRNFSKKVNKQMRQAALRMVLSDKVKNDHLIVLEAWDIATSKTKALADVLKKLPSASKKSLVVTLAKDKNVIQASKNLPKVMSIGAANLNVLDVMKYEYLVASKEAVTLIQDRYKK
jgi:large subunit ribosomal protein L4